MPRSLPPRLSLAPIRTNVRLTRRLRNEGGLSFFLFGGGVDDLAVEASPSEREDDDAIRPLPGAMQQRPGRWRSSHHSRRW